VAPFQLGDLLSINTHRRFWYQVFTCVSDRLRFWAKPFSLPPLRTGCSQRRAPASAAATARRRCGCVSVCGTGAPGNLERSREERVLVSHRYL